MRSRAKSPLATEQPGAQPGIGRLASYLAATAGAGSVFTSQAHAVVVSNSSVQPFGINQEVNIDFNNDGQIDFQIDHDRVNLNGVDLDYLQLDKNDVSSAENPYPIDNFVVFPTNDTPPNSDHGYATDAGPGELGYYPSALMAGDEIGPTTHVWDFQEGDNFLDQDFIIRANRLIDEDATQIDSANPNPPAGKTPFVPFGSPGWIGLGGETRYLGVRIDLNDEAQAGINSDPLDHWYGWIGLRITNEADATGEVVGWGYETELGMPIMASESAPLLMGDYNGNGTVDAADYVAWRDTFGQMGAGLPADGNANNEIDSGDYTVWQANFGNTAASTAVMHDQSEGAVPEPGSLLLAAVAGLALIGAFLCRRIRRR